MMTKEQQKMAVENLETARMIACLVRRPPLINWDDWLADAEYALCLAVLRFAPEKGTLIALASTILKRFRNRIVIATAIRNKRIGRRCSLEYAPAPNSSPAQQVEASDLVARALGELSPRDREALTMSVDGATGQEIAQRLGVSRDQAFVTVCRARKRVRQAVPETVAV